MVSLLVQIIIALLIAGFLVWAVRRVVAIIPMEPIIAQVIDAIIIIAVVAIILFYVVIPLLHALAGININITGLK
jgi:hypothetical protein